MRTLILVLAFGVMSLEAYCDEKIKYVTQILEPTGGRIEKPDKWFYTERHGGPSLTWILSEENPDLGAYDTGVRIQLIQGIKEITGKTPEEFIKKFVSDKKQVARVLNECKATEQGLFYRMCLETIEIATEGNNARSHIQYSLFWNNEIDLGVFVTSGTSVELWPMKKDIFKRMEAFEFIDMKRFDNAGGPGA